jgi:hypothetical protein
MGRYLPLVLVAALIGCGASGPTDSRSAVGVRSAANRLVAAAAAGRYHEACEGLTAAARAPLEKERNGCTFVLLLARPFLLGQMGIRFRAIFRNMRITGDTVLYRGAVQARYEQGRWHFENTVW